MSSQQWLVQLVQHILLHIMEKEATSCCEWRTLSCFPFFIFSCLFNACHRITWKLWFCYSKSLRVSHFETGLTYVYIYIHIHMSVKHFVSFYAPVIRTWTVLFCVHFIELFAIPGRKRYSARVVKKYNCRTPSAGCNKRNETLDIVKSVTLLPTKDITIVRTELIKIILKGLQTWQI
jgi:hypothetical protein